MCGRDNFQILGPKFVKMGKVKIAGTLIEKSNLAGKEEACPKLYSLKATQITHTTHLNRDSKTMWSRQDISLDLNNLTGNKKTPSIDQGGQHLHHILQDTKLLCFCDFQANKIAHVLPYTGMAAHALKGAALDRVGSGRQCSVEERDQ